MIVNEPRRVYYIPDNFVTEGTVLQGTIKLKNLIEGIAMGLPLALLGTAISGDTPSKVILAILFGGPLLLFGITGYNGDPLSVVLKSMRSWRKNRCTMLYRVEPRLLAVSPTDVMFSEQPAADRIAVKLDDMRKNRLRRKLSKKYIEGETFEFEKDSVLERYASVKDVEHTEFVIADDYAGEHTDRPRSMSEEEDF